MDDLHTLMLRSYRRHPHFQFVQSELELSPRTLAAFDEAYEFVRTFRAGLQPRQWQQSRGRCERTLTAAFAELRPQASDAMEERFLQELERECLRLLQEEFIHFRAHPTVKGIELSNPAVLGDALRLQRDRHYFGQLPASAVNEILAIGAPRLAEFRERARQGRLTRDDLSFNAGPQIRPIKRILNREFATLGVLDAVSAYMGRRMRVSGFAFELSVPQATWWANSFADLPRAPSTLYAHLDESIATPKSIVYLTDVTTANGPTSCYPQAFQSMRLSPLAEMIGRVVSCVGAAADSPLREYYGKAYHQSMSSPRFRQHFMRLPEALRFNSHLGWDVLPDSDAEQSLASCETSMIGAAGTYIVFDGATLIHRGGLVQEGERIALQVTFSDLTLPRRVAAKLKRVLS